MVTLARVKRMGLLRQLEQVHAGSLEVALKSSQWTDARTASTYKTTSLSPLALAMYALCSSNSLVSRVTSLVSAIARVTALVPSVARVTAALVLPIIVVGGIFLSVTLHLLAVIEVLAFGLDELIGFSACEAGKEVFGHGMIFGDTCARQGYVRTGITWYIYPEMDAREWGKRVLRRGWDSLPLASSCC